MGLVLPEGSEGMQWEAHRRAGFVRTIAEVLSAEAPLAELWPRVCVPLALLADADRVALMLDDDGRPVLAYATAPETAAAKQGRLAVPVRFGAAVLGEVLFDGVDSADQELLPLLESCALYVGARLHHERALRSSERYAELALTDALTGVANRRRFDETLEREWVRAQRARTPITAVIVDLDHFKLFNDAYGHQAGDLCLRQVASAFDACVKRPADLFARFGGEEFVALLPGTDLAGGIALGERFRTTLAELGVAHASSSLGRVSVSAGVASAIPEPGTPSAALLHAADEALYQAKRSGRDRVAAHGYSSQTEPAQRTFAGAPTNLPLQLTRLLGRKTEIAGVRTLLEQHRMVTITGSEGIGKTRVALQSASELADRYHDGIWFVDLAPISDPELVAAAVGAVCSVQLVPGSGAHSELARALTRKCALLVLDECAHVRDAVAETVAAVLRGCPHMGIIATSRAPLGVDDESVCELPPLEAPPSSATTVLGVAAYDAAALFVARAKSAKPGFALSEGDAAVVAEICRRLQGIPLAIEIAAARVSAFSVNVLIERLSERLRVLTTDDRLTISADETVRAALSWSHDLLSVGERVVFRRLAIFPASFDAHAASEVCGGDAAEHLATLVRTSLVVEDLVGGRSRYRLRGAARAFACEQLLAAGEHNAIARRHAEAYVRVAREAGAGVHTMPSREWAAMLRPELDNLRAAMAWAFGPDGDVAVGAVLAAAVSPFFADVARGEGARWVRRALDAAGLAADPAREARVLIALASFEDDVPPLERRRAAHRAVELFLRLGDQRRLTGALRILAEIVATSSRGERELADACAREAIALAREAGDPVQLALALRTRAITLSDDLAAKRALLAEALALMRAHANARSVTSILAAFSEVEFCAGDAARALALGREAAQTAEASGSPYLVIAATSKLAQYAAEARDWQTARSAAARAIELARDARAPQPLVRSLVAFAVVAAVGGDFRRAAWLLGFAEGSARLTASDRVDPSDDLLRRALVGTLRGALGDGGFEAALAEGGRLDEEAVLSLLD